MSILTETIGSKLIEQYKHEMRNHFRYKARASFGAIKGLTNTEAFFNREAQGEFDHAQKVFSYLNQKNYQVKIDPLDYNEPCPDSFQALFTTALEIERGTTIRLKEIAKSAFEINDLETFFFLSDMIKEQSEEEELYQTILDRLALLGLAPTTVHDMDVWVGTL